MPPKSSWLAPKDKAPPRATITPLLLSEVPLVAKTPVSPTMTPAFMIACAAESVTSCVLRRAPVLPILIVLPVLLSDTVPPPAVSPVIAMLPSALRVMLPSASKRLLAIEPPVSVILPSASMPPRPVPSFVMAPVDAAITLPRVALCASAPKIMLPPFAVKFRPVLERLFPLMMRLRLVMKDTVALAVTAAPFASVKSPPVDPRLSEAPTTVPVRLSAPAVAAMVTLLFERTVPPMLPPAKDRASAPPLSKLPELVTTVAPISSVPALDAIPALLI